MVTKLLRYTLTGASLVGSRCINVEVRTFVWCVCLYVVRVPVSRGMMTHIRGVRTAFARQHLRVVAGHAQP
jgi:hypothetical protein